MSDLLNITYEKLIKDFKEIQSKLDEIRKPALCWDSAFVGRNDFISAPVPNDIILDQSFNVNPPSWSLERKMFAMPINSIELIISEEVPKKIIFRRRLRRKSSRRMMKKWRKRGLIIELIISEEVPKKIIFRRRLRRKSSRRMMKKWRKRGLIREEEQVLHFGNKMIMSRKMHDNILAQLDKSLQSASRKMFDEIHRQIF